MFLKRLKKLNVKLIEKKFDEISKIDKKIWIENLQYCSW